MLAISGFDFTKSMMYLHWKYVAIRVIDFTKKGFVVFVLEGPS